MTYHCKHEYLQQEPLLSARSRQCSMPSTCCAWCSNIRDMLTFINTVIVHPEALNLTKEAVTSLTTPIVVPLLSNGSKNSNFTDGEGFAKGVSAFGSPGQPHGVSPLSSFAPC